MLKKFFVSKKLNEAADAVEKNAERGADKAVKALNALNESTEAFGAIGQVIASAYRLLRIVLTVITTDSEEGKLFRSLLVDLYKAYAKRLRDSAGFVTALTKNKKIMRAIEAFEEDVGELKAAVGRKYLRNKRDEIEKLRRRLGSMLKAIRKRADNLAESVAYEKAYMKYVLAARTRIAELMASGEDCNGEAFARLRHLEDSLDTYPKVPEFREDEKGWEWFKYKDEKFAARVDRKDVDDE